MVSPQDSSYQNPARADAAGNGRGFLAPPRLFPHCSFHTFLHGTAQGGTDQTAWAEHPLETDPFPSLRFVTLGSALCRHNYRLLVPGVPVTTTQPFTVTTRTTSRVSVFLTKAKPVTLPPKGHYRPGGKRSLAVNTRLTHMKSTSSFFTRAVNPWHRPAREQSPPQFPTRSKPLSDAASRRTLTFSSFSVTEQISGSDAFPILKTQCMP